jgi:translation elongation factor EF-G
LGYVTALRSMTSGRGIFSMEFERYVPVDQAIAGEIIHAKKNRGST